MKARKSRDDTLMSCPRCRRPNPVELIYCDDPDCVAVLHPVRIACNGCRAPIPVNALFCPECGQATGYGKERGKFYHGVSGPVRED